jgi:predicted DNA-binding transcriptional regulator AlpA
MEAHNTPQSGPPQVLTREEVARLLRLTPQAIYNLHRKGALRGRVIGGRLRWRMIDVDAFIASVWERA